MGNFKNLKYRTERGSEEMGRDVAIIGINRPQSYNALDREAKLELIGAIGDAASDDSVGAIVITGEGRAFCSGQDLGDPLVDPLIAGNASKVNLKTVLKEEWVPLVNAVRDCPKITIAAVGGACAGAGLSLALACDLVVSTSDSKFVSGFSKIGLVPDAGLTFTMVRHLGRYRALEFFLSNTPLKGEELKAAGLVYKTGDDCLSLSISLGKEICAMAPMAVTAIKQNVRHAEDHKYQKSVAREVKSQSTLGKSSDYLEGVAAFKEKRSPTFTGK